MAKMHCGYCMHQVLKEVKNYDCKFRDITFYTTCSFYFLKPGAYITYNAIWQVSEITGGSLLDFMQLPREYYFFHV